MIESPHKGQTGLRRVLNAFCYSLEGLKAAFRHEDALGLPVGGVGKALMAGSVVLVLVVELLNSAVEAAVDRISLENHRLAKRAKDIGSAAVFLTLLNVPLTWSLVLWG